VGVMPCRRSSARSMLAFRADCSPFILTPRLSVPSQTNCASSLVERAAGADLTAERVADMCLFSPAGIPMPARTGMVAGIGAAGTPPPAGQGGLLEEPVPPPRRWSPGRIAADRGGGVYAVPSGDAKRHFLPNAPWSRFVVRITHWGRPGLGVCRARLVRCRRGRRVGELARNLRGDRYVVVDHGLA